MIEKKSRKGIGGRKKLDLSEIKVSISYGIKQKYLDELGDTDFIREVIDCYLFELYNQHKK